ncbi:MAG: RnfABCDGE type electron transport complex subunit B [Methyloversatilis sp.]|uniref:RnfABCDGE type electron transport complex subunit B n=1 Tax=Methyloversatilis sp. TaxID=2569862 RepID=UPI00273699A1|nr:RnfABCDGE type electron transport complex subunit B [Methyloversatilis sp.]MDP3872167.1 RnfABCDGE type electron transport complex subunit B [Methyloversatilis sp.]
MEQMITAVMSLAAIGSGLGVVLGVAARKFAVEGDSRVEEIVAMLPAANCGQCGFPGCEGAAQAIVEGEASPTCCPPGGKVVALAIAGHLGITLGDDDMEEAPKIAVIEDAICIGCTKCYRLCPSDAIVGAMKQLHGVFAEACTGCNQCADKCPTGAITMQALPATAGTWVMPKPVMAA